jgi:hypothetical protein
MLEGYGPGESAFDDIRKCDEIIKLALDIQVTPESD